MATIVILQPGYLPWLGFFDQLRRADVFVLYDDVQFDKHGWRNRNRIKTPGGPQWLTVPVRTGGRLGQLVRDTEIDSSVRWASKHLQSLRTNYARAPHFDACMAAIEPVLSNTWRWLADLDEALMHEMARLFSLPTPVTRSSLLGIAGGQSDRLVRICEYFGATTYLSGAAARDYLDVGQFQKAGIVVEFQDYVHPEYPQLHGPFLPYLSAIDYLMNVGPSAPPQSAAKIEACISARQPDPRRLKTVHSA